MSSLRIAFLGDIFGSPGRQIVRTQLPILREQFQPDIVIANAENARDGSGLSAKMFEQMRNMGVDGMTLGDHCYRDKSILPLLDDPDAPVARPFNLPATARGKGVLTLSLPGKSKRKLVVITLLGRVFMNQPIDDPFASIDRALAEIDNDTIVIVETHMEATSEKAAVAHYVDGRAAAVLGTHTHVQTSDARVLPGGTAFISDIGMCGPHHSIIGKDIKSVLHHMTTGSFVRFAMGEGDDQLSGAVVDIDAENGLATAIQAVRFPGFASAVPSSN